MSDSLRELLRDFGLGWRLAAIAAIGVLLVGLGVVTDGAARLALVAAGSLAIGAAAGVLFAAAAVAHGIDDAERALREVFPPSPPIRDRDLRGGRD